MTNKYVYSVAWGMKSTYIIKKKKKKPPKFYYQYDYNKRMDIQ
jgi:hypothetical protein